MEAFSIKKGKQPTWREKLQYLCGILKINTPDAKRSLHWRIID